MDFNNAVIVKMQADVNSIIGGIQNVVDVNKDLGNRVKALEDERKISNVNVNDLFIRLDCIEQERLANSVEIVGVEHVENENVMERVINVCYALCLGYAVSDINYAYRRVIKMNRGEESTQPSPIIAFFNNLRLRNDLLLVFRRHSGLTNDDIGLNSDKKIYVNENLTVWW